MATMTVGYPSLHPAPLRLTRRGRAVVRGAALLAIVVLSFALLSLGKGVAAAAFSGDASTPVASHSVVVRAGDTLWTIAARELPGMDTREGIARLRTLNAMTPADRLIAGSTLLVPVA